MKKEWILSTAFKNKNIDSFYQFVHVDIPKIKTGSLDNLFDSNISTICNTGYEPTTFQSINFTFENPITIYGYKIEVVYSQRYLKGWNLETSMNGEYFEILDSKTEKFCFSDYIHEDYIDCGETTSREFPTQTKMAKYVKLVQTDRDSCNSYAFHMSTFDIFGYLNVENICEQSITQYSSIILVSIFIII